ncbi:hypothetical protein HA466_0105310 [Hirschfeldia incana]|nr:hypothetical protein HA466_0105310 [Hirschfeldia incana]
MRQEHRSQTHISLIPDHSPYDLLFPNFFYISISRSLNGSRQVFRSQFSLLTLVPTPKGYKVDEGIELLSKTKEADVAPNVVTCDAVINGVVISGKYDEAFVFKEKMVEK